MEYVGGVLEEQVLHCYVARFADPEERWTVIAFVRGEAVPCCLAVAVDYTCPGGGVDCCACDA